MRRSTDPGERRSRPGKWKGRWWSSIPATVSEETAEIPEISDEPATSDAGIAGTAVSLDSDLDLDLDLPDLSGEPGKEVPVAAAPVRSAPLSPAPVSALVTEEVEEDLVIELVDEEMEGEEAAEAFDPDKASQFDFYLEQRLVEEAEEVLSAMERSAPGHPEVVKRRVRLADFGPADAVEPPVDRGGDLDMDVERAFGRGPVTEEEAAPSPEAAPPAPDEGFFDLGAELKAHVLEGPGESAASDPAAGISGGEEASIDEIFKAFRKKVDQQVEEEDYDTRYNLGIAYKEMGLLDEAIGEFQLRLPRSQALPGMLQHPGNLLQGKGNDRPGHQVVPEGPGEHGSLRGQVPGPPIRPGRSLHREGRPRARPSPSSPKSTASTPTTGTWPPGSAS